MARLLLLAVAGNPPFTVRFVTTKLAAAAASNTSSSDGGGGGGGSSSRGVNAVAAILVVASSIMVLLALRLWLCRCMSTISAVFGRQDPLDEPQDMECSSKMPVGGIKKEVIEKLATTAHYNDALGDKVCMVCLSEFSTSELQLRLLPGCNHCFHAACIDMWLFSHTSCPICRKSLLDAPAQVQV